VYYVDRIVDGHGPRQRVITQPRPGADLDRNSRLGFLGLVWLRMQLIVCATLRYNLIAQPIGLMIWPESFTTKTRSTLILRVVRIDSHVDGDPN
jgi:hypothetical protein